MNFMRKVFSISTLLLVAFSASHLFAFEINGFSDVTFSQSSSDFGDNNRPFAIGQVDFYAIHNIDDQLDVLLEYVIESDETGEWIVDLERIQIGYYFNDLLKIRAGRFHKTIGYWNPTYHHAAQLHTTINRPKFLEFEDDGGLIPVHTVGAWFSGLLENNAGSITYDLMIGNGSKLSDGALDPNNAGDNSRDKEVTLNLQYEPYGIIGSGVGIFASTSKIGGTSTAATTVEVTQLIMGADIFLNYDNIEFLSEIFNFSTSDETGNTSDTSATGLYAQAGITYGNYTPYLRYETFQRDDTDIYFDAIGAGEYNKNIVGVRYNIHNRSSLKLEGDFHDDKTTDDKYGTYRLQWTFLF